MKGKCVFHSPAELLINRDFLGQGLIVMGAKREEKGRGIEGGSIKNFGFLSCKDVVLRKLYSKLACNWKVTYNHVFN